jgi:branched-chain amino acid transport system permease protein
MQIDFSLIIGQIMTGLVLGGILALVASGFVLVFGMMDIINFAHGIFFALGSYFAYTALALIGNFWVALVIVPFAVGIVGYVTECLILRPLSGRPPTYSLLATFGFTLAAVQAIRLIWGKTGLPFSTPDSLVGATDLGVVIFPTYRLFVLLVTGVIITSLWLFIEKTSLGSIIRAGTSDSLMAEALGINITRVWSLVFALGCSLAGLAGVLAAPMQGVYAEMGLTIIIECFVIVVIAGLGSIGGAVISSLMIGTAVSMATLIYPPMANVIIFLLMIVVLLIKPAGLFGSRA